MTVCQFLKKVIFGEKKVEGKKFSPNYDFRTMSKEELALGKMVNEYRISYGLKPLFYEMLHYKVSTTRVEYFTSKKLGTKLSHEGFFGEASELYSMGLHVAENIAFGYGTNEGVLEGWKKSYLHNKALLKPDWEFTGISIKEDSNGRKYYCQIFGKRIIKK
jgi:uncharacterized protein YkwD